jgi:SSS family solute:Na+ symporter
MGGLQRLFSIMAGSTGGQPTDKPSSLPGGRSLARRGCVAVCNNIRRSIWWAVGDACRAGLKPDSRVDTAICLGFACAVLFPYYIRTKVFTIPEFLELRYSGAARLFFSGLMLVICIMTKMAFTLFAGALVLHNLMGWEIMQVVVILAFSRRLSRSSAGLPP